MLSMPYIPWRDPTHCPLIPSRIIRVLGPSSTSNTNKPSRPAPDYAQSMPRKVWLLEGGYTSDTRQVEIVEKIEEKRQQHKTLLKALEMQRLWCTNAEIGAGETIYKRTQNFLQGVGIDPVEMKRLLKDIHLHSVEYLHNIVVQRRQLDSEAPLHAIAIPLHAIAP